MAINLKFDLMGNPEPPSIVLATRSGNKLGQLNVKTDSIDVIDKFNDASEFSFTLNKYVDGELTPLWDKVVDFKLVYCPQWDLWFEIRVELDEATETVKTVFCTQLGQAELSQIKLYDIHINEEGDPNWDVNGQSYKSTILYDENDASISLLNRLLKDKAPHYSIRYVSPTIARIQRTFSFDDISIYDAFQEIAEEIGCLFVFHSNSGEDGKIQRAISVYDLQQKCNACGYRGEFTDKCPECNSTNITNGYGDDTLIFVTSDELATEGIQLTTDTDSVKNCFKLKAGDDLMTATVRNCNPNGTDYIWYFSDAVKEDMSDELVEKIESYDTLYKDCYDNRESTLDAILVSKYNALVDKYKDYYNTSSICLNCGHEEKFYDKCSKCGNENILTGRNLQTISSPIKGYSSLMTTYYDVIDLGLYLKSGLMPSIEMSETTAEEQIKLLDSVSLSPVAVNVKDVNSITTATANSAVLSMAKVIIKPTYKVEIKEPDTTTLTTNDKKTKTWKGKFVVTNYSDEEDTAESGEISVEVNNDSEKFIKQKIDKALKKANTDDYSISGLFEKDYNAFCEELKKYALNPLQSFYDACQTCLSILTEQGVRTDTNSDLYKNLYAPYNNKSDAIAKEIAVRQNEINTITGKYDIDGNLEVDGLQQSIESCRNDIQEALDFETYLSEDLWLEFCLYRREDTYSNDNYISDGLNNAELFDKALEFFKVAENEIYKSAELQHSISTTLNNLLGIEKFKPLVDSFKVGNWIRVQIDDKVFKLRLLECKFGYGDVENISVEFSDVIKIKNGITDIQDVISQASSMATSYSSVKKQADQGSIAQGTIEQWIANGLDAANTQIKNNNAEEITITSSGLLGRSYDFISGTYSDEQIKLTHNILAYTDDGWNTVKQAIGKHKYTKWENNKWIENVDGYGSTSDFVTAGYITGSQVIGGEIVSSNYKPREQGTYINLIDGDFEFAGGKIVYDTDNKALTLKDVTIQWDSTNAPEITNITGLGEYLDQIKDLEDKVDGTQTSAGEAYERAEQAEENAKDYADAQDTSLSNILTDAYKEYTNSQINNLDSYVAQYLGLGGNTIIGEDYVISPIIEGGYLNITNVDNNSRVIIDPNNLTGNNYIFQVHNGDKVTVGVDKDGNTEFSGKVTASTIKGSTIEGGSLSISDENGTTYAEITSDGKLSCGGAEITGEIHAIEGGTIGGFKIGNNNIYHTKTSYNDTINDGVYLGTDGIGLGKGVFYVNDSGEMTSTKGKIGGWTISDESIRYEDYSVGIWCLTNPDKNQSRVVSNSLIDGTKKYICFLAGAQDYDFRQASFRVLEDGSLYASAAEIKGDITATSGKIGAWNLTGDFLYSERDETGEIDIGYMYPYTKIFSGLSTWSTIDQSVFFAETKASLVTSGVYSPVRFYAGAPQLQGESNQALCYSRFSVLEDGSLYASAAEIKGTIYAENGEFNGTINAKNGFIGGLKIQSNSISTGDNGLTFTDQGYAKIQQLQIDDKAMSPQLQTGLIRGRLSDSVCLNFETGNIITEMVPIKVSYVVIDQGSNNWLGNVNKPGAAQIIVESDWELTETKIIRVNLVYKKGDNTKTDYCYVQINAGSAKGSTEVVYRVQDYGAHLLSSVNSDISEIRQQSKNTSIHNINCQGGFVPMTTNTYTLGQEDLKWKEIWCTQSSINSTSDRNEKHSIESLPNKYDIFFDCLKPVRYKFNQNESNRFHVGFIAQDVKDALDNAEIPSSDFAGYLSFDKEDGTKGYGLRYSEFIALCVNEIQKLKKRVAELENK